MTLTPEHREALIAEAVRRAYEDGTQAVAARRSVASHTLDLIETGWKPKPSKALLATREALKRTYYHYSDNIDAGRWDGSEMAKIPRHAYELGRESVLGEGAREVIFDAMAKHSPGTLSKQADAILTALRERE